MPLEVFCICHIQCNFNEVAVVLFRCFLGFRNAKVTRMRKLYSYTKKMFLFIYVVSYEKSLVLKKIELNL